MLWSWNKFLLVSFVFLSQSTISIIRAERLVPALSGPVIDEAGLLSTEEVSQLENLIRGLQPQVQAQVWIFSELDGEPIEGLSIRAAEKWKLGTEKNDNGLVILVAVTDRRMRIEVGQGLEGDIPDAFAGRVIDQVLRPNFRSKNYYEGLVKALMVLGEAAGASVDKKSFPQGNSEGLPSLPIGLIVILFFLFGPLIGSLLVAVLRASGVPIRRNIGRGTSWGGGSWGGGGFGGGGGGWSGGGGGFSGGGASGDW